MSARTDWAQGFIAVDWGTTNRRAYLVEPGRTYRSEFEDGRGIMALQGGGFEAAVAQIRQRLGDWPMLLAGMIGSNRGWIEAPYVPCPAGADELARALVWVDERTAIVPGVSYLNSRADVMRGEEVQVIGSVAAGEIPPDALVCHPGTHNKWIRMRGGRIDSFRTVMTGELYSLLKAGSILSDLLAGPATPGDAFLDGVLRTLASGGATSALFEARASVLLGRLHRADSPSFVSGLLIGEDVRIGIEDRGDVPVVAMGRPELTRLYEAALEIAGVDCEEVDGEKAFVAGACEIVERMK